MAFTAYGLLSYYEVSRDERAKKSAEKILHATADHFLNHPEIDILNAFGKGTEHLSILLPASRFYRLTKDAKTGELLQFIRQRLDGSPLDFLHFDSIFDLQSTKGIEIFVLLIGLCDYGEQIGDREILAGCERYWEQLYRGQIRSDGNGTVKENWYEGGNAPQYLSMDDRPSENCVAVGWLEFSVMLYRMTKKIKYLNVIDRTLYNHILGAIDENGKDFAYYQPNFGKRHTDTPEDMYKCCRYRGYSLISKLPESLFFREGNQLTAGIYANGVYEDDYCRISEKTDFPYSSEIMLNVDAKTDLTIRLRIPENMKVNEVTVNGAPIKPELSDGAVQMAVRAGKTEIKIIFRPELMLTKGQIDEKNVFSYSYGPVLLVAETKPNGDWKTLSASSRKTPIQRKAKNGFSFSVSETELVDMLLPGEARDGSLPSGLPIQIDSLCERIL